MSDYEEQKRMILGFCVGIILGAMIGYSIGEDWAQSISCGESIEDAGTDLERCAIFAEGFRYGMKECVTTTTLPQRPQYLFGGDLWENNSITLDEQGYPR